MFQSSSMQCVQLTPSAQLYLVMIVKPKRERKREREEERGRERKRGTCRQQLVPGEDAVKLILVHWHLAFRHSFHNQAWPNRRK